MTEKRFVKHYAGRTEKRAIGIKDIETSRVYVTLEENIHLLNELVDENKELKAWIEQLKKKNLKLKKGLDDDFELIIFLQGENNQLKELSDCEKLQKVLIEHKEHLLDCKRHDEPTAYWDGALDCIDNISEILGVDFE